MGEVVICAEADCPDEATVRATIRHADTKDVLLVEEVCSVHAEFWLLWSEKGKR